MLRDKKTMETHDDEEIEAFDSYDDEEDYKSEKESEHKLNLEEELHLYFEKLTMRRKKMH